MYRNLILYPLLLVATYFYYGCATTVVEKPKEPVRRESSSISAQKEDEELLKKIKGEAFETAMEVAKVKDRIASAVDSSLARQDEKKKLERAVLEARKLQLAADAEEQMLRESIRKSGYNK
jgi:hypothetical protein